ncbi:MULTISPECIES: hypothetical protein [Sphingomonas]|uniref:hypothetical protein n=1 Tax=Sphingomonas TaxID=13687 RepID=UPI001E5E7A6C|nr:MULTISPECIES: hypothetical protein [Sphingomonas]
MSVPAMNLLLLLSALLSALSGLGGGVRQAPVAQQGVAQQVRDVVVSTAAARVALRPTQPNAALADVVAAPVVTVLRLAAAEPIFARRRRE